MEKLSREEKILRDAAKEYTTDKKVFTIRRHKTALIVIDMQVDFVDREKGKLWLPDTLIILPQLKKLIKK